MPSVDFNAHEHRWLQWSPYWKMAGVYVIKGTIPGWFGGEYAYVGLSRNIAKRWIMYIPRNRVRLQRIMLV